MSWFDEQLRTREEHDDLSFTDSLDSIAGAVMGKRLAQALDSHEIASSAIDAILRYYHVKWKNDDLPPQVKTIEDQLEYRMRPFGITYRAVELDKGWYNHAVGAMLGTLKEDGSAVALIPGKLSGYSFFVLKTGKRVKLNRKTEQLLDHSAVCFYQPLPQKALNVADLLRFMFEQLNMSDLVLTIALMAGSTLLGLLSPLFRQWLFSDVLNSGSLQVLIALACFMLGYTVSKLCFSCFQALISSRIGVKQNIAVQAAVMNRLMSLPATFFKKYSPGELTQRSSYVQSLCSTLYSTIGTTALTSLFSIIYIGQISAFAPALVVPSLLITAVSILFSLLVTLIQMKITREKMELSTKTSGMTYATISGIQKIKLAGAEKRMFARWAKQYSKEAKLEYSQPMFLKLAPAITLAISLLGTLITYALAIESHVSVADYYAFSGSFGMVSTAFMNLSSIAISIANIKPTLEMARPIMEAEPETADDREIVTALRGGIELSHVSFRYDESMPNVIDDMSLRIRPGEYVAIVGSTGCGKSTLLRLMLGFEKPQKGSIYFDKSDINHVDLHSLRRHIGVVLQDGKLFSGDIYSNIVIAAPHLTLAEAWDAAEKASIADDIRRMPMGMSTIISEGQGGISGGQKQRIMIARALAPKPKILMFDEATSALDNVTQKHVSDSIDAVKCTRIVIAHRLSTIRHADRIICLDHGKIIEEGKYEALIEKDGFFAELVKRQRLDVETD